MDHACLKKTKAAQHRAISLKLYWNIFKLHISKTISAKILQVALTSGKEKGQSCFPPTIPGSAKSFAKSTIQPSYIDIAIWIQAFALIFSKPLILPVNDRNTLPIDKLRKSRSLSRSRILKKTTSSDSQKKMLISPSLMESHTGQKWSRIFC